MKSLSLRVGLALALCTSLASSSLASDAVGLEVVAGQRVVVPVSVDAGEGASGFDFLLGYDPKVLRPVLVTVTSWTTAFSISGEIEVPGRIHVAGTGPRVYGSGEAVWIAFDVLDRQRLATEVVWFDRAVDGRRSDRLPAGYRFLIGGSGAWIGFPKCASGLSGNEVESGIYVDEIRPFRSLGLELRFDPDRLELLEVQADGGANGCSWARREDQPGRESLSLSCPEVRDLHDRVGTLVFRVAEPVAAVPIDLYAAATEREIIGALGDGVIAVCEPGRDLAGSPCCRLSWLEPPVAEFEPAPGGGGRPEDTGATPPVPSAQPTSEIGPIGTLDTTAEVGNTLPVVRNGSIAELTWSNDGIPGPFNVYRGGPSRTQGVAFGCDTYQAPESHAVDPDVPPPGVVFFYAVSRLGTDGESAMHRDSAGTRGILDRTGLARPCPQAGHSSHGGAPAARSECEQIIPAAGARTARSTRRESR